MKTLQDICGHVGGSSSETDSKKRNAVSGTVEHGDNKKRKTCKLTSSERKIEPGNDGENESHETEENTDEGI